MILVLALSLLCGISQKQATFALAILKFIIDSLSDGRDMSISHRRSLDDLPNDYRTLLNRFDLEPRLRSYICCPSCFALYDDSPNAQDVCSHRRAVDLPSCGSNLFRSRAVKGQVFKRPIRKYVHQDMKQWVARLLSRPDVEIRIESARNAPQSAEIRDIHDSSAIQSLHGPDGKPFFVSNTDELRLIFSLCVDGFNAFGMKIGGGPGSVTGIYMACLSLPIEDCFKPENMYLVGVVPGPHKPSEDEINHFLRPLVDDLLDFWKEGVRYSRTHLYPAGRLVRAALIPLVCDVLGARQTGGFTAHSATLFCSLCYLPADQIENFNVQTWPLRTAEMHRRHANAWKDAKTLTEKSEITKNFGVRYSELLRLPYWDPISFTIVESMHAFFLRILPEHIRRAWGVSVKAPCGDGHCAPDFTPPEPPSDEQVIASLKALQRTQECNSEEALGLLRKLKANVLWHLCRQFNLRRAGSSLILSRTLLDWVASFVLYILAADIVLV